MYFSEKNSASEALFNHCQLQMPIVFALVFGVFATVLCFNTRKCGEKDCTFSMAGCAAETVQKRLLARPLIGWRACPCIPQ